MKKFAVLFALLCVLIIGYRALRTEQPEPVKSDAPTANVPADTAFYSTFSFDKASWASFGQLPIRLPSYFADPDQAVLQQVAALVQAFNSYRLTQHLGTYAQLFDAMGVDAERETQFYLHGAYPVLRMHLNNPEHFTKFMQQLSDNSDLALEQESVQGQDYQRIHLLKAQADESSLWFAFAIQNDIATLSLISDHDQPATVAERLTFTQPAQSLADSSELSDVQQQLSTQSNNLAFLNIARLGEGLAGLGNSRLAKDMPALMSMLGQKAYAPVASACHDDLKQLLSQVPRFEMGADLSAQGLTSTSLLEVKSAPLLKALTAIQGQLPVNIPQGARLSFHLGIDMDALAPQLTQVWQSFINAPVDCDAAKSLQEQVSAYNPALLGFLTGAVQGIKGSGVTLYDLQLPADYQNATTSGDDTHTAAKAKSDFLVDILTDKPEALAALLNSWLGDVTGDKIIPGDRGAVQYDLSDMLPELHLTVEQQAHQVVAHTGERSDSIAQALADDKGTERGFIAMDVDYPALAQWSESVPGQMLSFLASQPDFCFTQAQIVAELRGTPWRLHSRLAMNEKGLVEHSTVELEPQAVVAAADLSGEYDLLDLSEDCNMPVIMGHESLNKDGTGHFSLYDETGQCSVMEHTYNWRQMGDQIYFKGVSSRSREQCDQPWQALSIQAAACDLFSVSEGFNCLYRDSGGEALLGYRRTGSTGMGSFE